MLIDGPKRQQWRRWDTLRSAVLHAPRTPGVYVIGKREWVMGLPQESEWAYVGRSDNLRRRLADHDQFREENAELRAWLARNSQQIEVWYLPTTAKEARSLEKQLIQRVNPRFNLVRYIGDISNG